MLPLSVAALHAKANSPKEPEQADNHDVQQSVKCPLHILSPIPCCEVEAEPSTKDSEVERRVVVVNVGNTCHGDEGKVMKKPANDRVDSSVVDLIYLTWSQIGISTLPANKVERN